MTIEHTLLPPALVDQHARAWTAIARQFAEVLAGPSPAPVPRRSAVRR
jgi:hypothetical protein